MFTNSTIPFADSHLKPPSTLLPNHKTAEISHDSTLLPIAQHAPPPKYPNYLKLTAYSNLAHEQYEAVTRHSLSPVLGTDVTMTQHGTDSDEHFASLDLRLPSVWNDKDRARYISVDDQGLVLKYVGPGKTEAHAGSIRANFPMRSQAGVFYYEVEILSKGEDGYIGIGFCTKENDLERLPGWDVDSFGYHGDDGHGFAGSGTGDTFGPKFTTGDIVGCGVNFADASAFYTKNGRLIGTAFSGLNLSKQYYPVIGLRTPGEHVKTNFGYEDFVFDVALYIKDHTTLIWKDVVHEKGSSKPIRTSTKFSQSNNDMVSLVIEYLLHHGYGSSARALVKDSHATTNDALERLGSNRVSKEAKQRQDINNAIMDGRIEESIRLIDLYYPSVLNQETLLFELKCAEIVELMRKYILHRKANWSSRSSDRIIPKEEPSLDYEYLHHQLSIHWSTAPQHIDHQRRNITWDSAGAYERPSSPKEDCFLTSFGHQPIISANNNAEDMTIPSPISASPSSTCSSSSFILALDSSARSQPPVTSKDILTLTTMDDYEESLLKSAMAMGQRLQGDYRMNKQSYIQEKIADVAALLADPENSPLTDPSCLFLLASQLNAAILESKVSCLEKICQHTVVVNKYLALEGNGKSILLNADSLHRIASVD